MRSPESLIEPGTDKPVLYFMCEDVADTEWFFEWFRRRHAPDVLNAGFESALCYRLIEGRQFVWDIYEIPSVEIFDTDAYRSIAQADDEMPYAMSLLSNRSVTCYEQIAGGTSGLEARMLSVYRFDCGADPRIPDGSPSGSHRWRLARRSRKQHPLWPSTEPEYVLVTEHSSLRDVPQLNEEIIARWLRVGDVTADRSVVERVHGLRKGATLGHAEAQS